MVNRISSVAFALVIALALQIHSKCIDSEEVRNILGLNQHKISVIPESRPMMLVSDSPPIEVPARIIKAMNENMARDNVDNADMDELDRLSSPNAMDDMQLALAMMENHDQMLRSRMRSALVEDVIESDLPPVDDIDLDSVPIGPIVDMKPSDAYDFFGIRRPDSEMRSMPLDMNQLSDYQIDWRPRRLLM